MQVKEQSKPLSLGKKVTLLNVAFIFRTSHFFQNVITTRLNSEVIQNHSSLLLIDYWSWWALFPFDCRLQDGNQTISRGTFLLQRKVRKAQLLLQSRRPRWLSRVTWREAMPKEEKGRTESPYQAEEKDGIQSCGQAEEEVESGKVQREEKQ